MKPSNWQNRFVHYKTDIPQCDDAHFKMFQMFDELIMTSTIEDRINVSMMILEFWKSHIAEEEMFMEKIEFPYIHRHKEEHDRLKMFLDKMLRHNGPINLDHTVKEFCDVFVRHIDEFDLQYADWWKKNVIGKS